MGLQSQFNFDEPAPDGLAQWRQLRGRASHRLAKRLGLPLEHLVEVWLKSGLMLRGQLQLKESVLFLETVDEKSLELVIGKVDFRYTDIESCVRMD